MTAEEIDKLKYPTGRFSKPDPITPEHINAWILEIGALPAQLKKQVEGLTKEQLSLRYRPDGWTIRQVVHHLADSHMNSLIRFKLSLTEDNPVIKPYKEDLWAEIFDGRDSDTRYSIQMLEGIHNRWVYLLKHLKPEQFDLTFIHPDRKGPQQLKTTLGLYAWHGKHHMAHIQNALNSNH
jgi:hypothetical protein